MSSASYLHGFTTAEQERLLRQAEYWSRTLITPGVEYKPGQSVLDIGCGCGAVLGVLRRAFPGIRCAGIDREPVQIDCARRHMDSLGCGDADLRTGDASKLPWADGSFDHVYMMWFLEHLADPPVFLREALRVLKPGGTITINETEYTTFKLWPQSPDWDLLERAQFDHFNRHGCALIGRRLGAMLHAEGFRSVRSFPIGFHFFRGADEDTAALRAHCRYIAGFLEPAIPELARLGYQEPALRRGLAHLLGLPDTDHASFTNIVYRAGGIRP